MPKIDHSVIAHDKDNNAWSELRTLLGCLAHEPLRAAAWRVLNDTTANPRAVRAATHIIDAPAMDPFALVREALVAAGPIT